MSPLIARLQGTAPWIRVAAALAGLVLLLGIEDLGAQRLNQLLLYAPGIDKVLHFVQSMCVFFVVHWLLGARAKGVRIVAAALVALGAAGYDELQQQLVAERHIELADIGAGLSGILFGAGVLARPARRTAAVLMASGLVACVAIFVRSYQETHDYNEGLLAEHDHRYADAARAYLRAIDRGVRNAELYNSAAWALLESSTPDPVRAVAFAGESLAMRPGDPNTLDTYGWALYRVGRHAEALASLEEAARLKPDIYCVHYHLGMASLALGERDEGIRHLRLQRVTDPHADETRLAAQELARLGAGTDGVQ